MAAADGSGVLVATLSPPDGLLMEGSLGTYSGTTLSPDVLNGTTDLNGGNGTVIGEDPIANPMVQAMFAVLYVTIFILGITGNVLVCYVVLRNKAMQTVTNFFITNLALADILLCAFGVPFTPIYTFLQDWVFGEILCRLVGYSQGVSVYISTLTLMSIAIDRYFVIIYPFKPRMKVFTCFGIITCIWIFALLITSPYGIYLHYGKVKDDDEDSAYFCQEAWTKQPKIIFTYMTFTLQFGIPFLVMAFCYIKVSLKLSDRVKAKPGSKSSKKEAMERERKRRTNRMLIAMVTIFGGCWLPLSLANLWNDVFESAETSNYNNLIFFCAHTIAMSSTCYNPFLYAWLNENFRKEFKQVLPCFYSSPAGRARSSRRCMSDRTCNGNETLQETFLQSTASQALPGHQSPKGHVLETIEEVTSSQSAAAVAINYEAATVKYSANNTNAPGFHELNQVQVHKYDQGSAAVMSPNVVVVAGDIKGGVDEIIYDWTNGASSGSSGDSGRSSGDGKLMGGGSDVIAGGSGGMAGLPSGKMKSFMGNSSVPFPSSGGNEPLITTTTGNNTSSSSTTLSTSFHPNSSGNGGTTTSSASNYSPINNIQITQLV